MQKPRGMYTLKEEQIGFGPGPAKALPQVKSSYYETDPVLEKWNNHLEFSPISFCKFSYSTCTRNAMEVTFDNTLSQPQSAGACAHK